MSSESSFPSLQTVSDSESVFYSDSSSSYMHSHFSDSDSASLDLRCALGRWRSLNRKTHAKFNTERELIVRSICDQKTRLNFYTHVGQLPEELLTQIFEHLVFSCYLSVCHGCTFSSQSQWIAPAHVCRRWRAVVLSTSMFWSFIFVDRHRAFSDLVARSMNAPLYIVARPKPTRSDSLSDVLRTIHPKILDHIVTESYRIRELCIEAKASDIQAVCTKLREPLRSLELLHLSATDSNGRFEFLFPPTRFFILPIDGLAPRLGHLEILRLSFVWTDSVFRCSSLTTLIVHGVLGRPHLFPDAPPSVGTMEQLLDVLARIAPRLRVLSLEEAIPPLPSGTISPPPPTRNISLPSLGSLRLAGSMVDCANLFNHLSPIPTSTVTLESRMYEVDRRTVGSAGIADVARHLSEHVGRSGPLLAVHVKFSKHAWSISCWRAADMSGDPPVLLKLAFSYGNDDEMPLTALLRGSDNMFAHVQYLKVTGDTFDVDWAVLFSRLPKLQTLECDGHPFGAFFAALSDVQPGLEPDGSPHIPLPELRTLRLIDVLFRRPAESDVEREFVDELLDWTILRCNFDRPLETLELGSCAHAMEIDVDLLAEVVPDVGWDEWDSEPERETVVVTIGRGGLPWSWAPLDQLHQSATLQDVGPPIDEIG